MTNFLDAYKNIDFKILYGSFDGRASRKDYVVYYLVPAFALSFATGIISGILNLSLSVTMTWFAFSISLLSAIAIAWIGIVMTTKRLHDWDKSGWMQLIFLIPIVGLIFWIVLFFVKGTPGANKYGADPLEATHVSK